jgi:hypothetical protein
MPFRSKATLEAWLEEFRASGNDVPGSVALQDGYEGNDTGLVVLRLSNAGTYTYMQPVAPHDARWEVTFEPREGSVSLCPADVDAMGAELRRIAALCEFLQAKSAAHLGALRQQFSEVTAELSSQPF